MDDVLRIGEYHSLGTAPYFYQLKNQVRAPAWTFEPGTPEELTHKLDLGELDVALVPSLALVDAPHDFVVLPDLGYGGTRHVRDMLLFSDMYLDDMDEMTISLPDQNSTVSNVMRAVLDLYLGYQNQFIIGWGQAEAYVLMGDAALRERALARYAYVYDVGDLWRHYTGKSMVYYLWAFRAQSVSKKPGLIREFRSRLSEALTLSRSNWSQLAGGVTGYDWVKKPTFTRLWDKVDYELTPEHIEGLMRFYEDCVDLGEIDEAPDLVFFEDDSCEPADPSPPLGDGQEPGA